MSWTVNAVESTSFSFGGQEFLFDGIHTDVQKDLYDFMVGNNADTVLFLGTTYNPKEND